MRTKSLLLKIVFPIICVIALPLIALKEAGREFGNSAQYWWLSMRQEVGSAIRMWGRF